MRASGFILRFVDVVLLLLFGFIAISNLQNSDVTLPESEETEVSPLDTDEIIFVGVMSDGSYLVENETIRLTDLRSLQEHLNAKRLSRPGSPFKVRIRSSFDAPVRYAFEVATLCDNMGLDKALEVALKSSDT